GRISNTATPRRNATNRFSLEFFLAFSSPPGRVAAASIGRLRFAWVHGTYLFSAKELTVARSIAGGPEYQQHGRDGTRRISEAQFSFRFRIGFPFRRTK